MRHTMDVSRLDVIEYSGQGAKYPFLFFLALKVYDPTTLTT